MFSNNVRDLPAGGWARHAALDDRGRIWALLTLYDLEGDRFLAVVDGGVAAGEAFVERIQRYLLFDDLTLTPLDLGPGVTVQGERAALALGDLPVPRGGAVAVGTGWVLRRDRTGAGGFDVFGAHPPGGLPVEAEDLLRLRVAAGRVEWPQDGDEKRLIHEIGLRDEVCNFEKGCYIGQETVNRVDVLGGVKRGLAGLVLPGAGYASGDPVEVGGVVVGRLTSPVEDGPRTLALAVLQRPADTPETVVTVRGQVGRVAAFPL
jgi:folate-binding protein YgfZ